MYKLTIVSGPNRGTSYAVKEGEISIGRQTGNVIVLSSARVSKRHCTLIVDQGDVYVKDLASSNGTFVNGVLTKSKKLRAGDRISVGEFVLELNQPVERSLGNAPAVPGFGNVLQFPGTGNTRGIVPAPISGALPAPSSPIETPQTPANQVPKDLKGKAIWAFENHLMPFFYGLNFKNEWRAVGLGLFIVFVVANLILTVFPILESNRSTIVKEAGKRAQFMAKSIAEKNTPALAAQMETKTDVGNVDHEDGIRVAVLVDLENRIMAPASKANQYLTNGRTANVAIKAREAFRKGRESGFLLETDSDTIVSIEPVKVLNPQLGKNVVVAMAVVALDTSLSTPGLGDIGTIYSQSLILTGLVGLLLLVIFYRITIKPFQVLNDDMDRVLKGEMSQVTHEFKFEELNQLWDVINSALQRIPKSASGGEAGIGDGLGFSSGPSIDEYVGPLRTFGEMNRFGLVVCDGERKVHYMNSIFEEISGIRAENATGQELSSQARDEGFKILSNDLFDRAPIGGDGIQEEYEFSGVPYRMHCAAFGSVGTPARCYVLMAVKVEG